MNPVSEQVLSAVWSVDDLGRYRITQQLPAGLLPEVNETTLPGWLKDALAGDGSGYVQQVVSALLCRQPFHVEAPIRCRDGTVRHLRITGLPAQTDVHYVGFIVDVTAQHAAFADVSRSAAKYRLLIENSRDLIAHCDTHGRYVSVSPSYGRMLGWADEEVVGHPVIDFLHPDDRAHADKALARISSGDVLPEVVEVRKRHRNGHYITLGTKARSVTDPATGLSAGAVLVSRDITADKEVIRQLERMATRDALTGLHNRAWFARRLEHMLDHAENHAHTTVLFIDLNGFKAVNDTLGHATGDALLKQVSKRLQECMRPGDAVARLGGDEFVVAAYCSDRSAASAIAVRLLDVIKTPFHIAGTDVRISAAIGISAARSGMGTVGTLLEKADAAMYEAKVHDSGAYRFFEADAPGLQ